MSEFEAEVADITDPSPLAFTAYDPVRGPRIADLVSELGNIIIDDLVMAMNKGKPAFCQYLYPDGTALNAYLKDAKTMCLQITHAEDRAWVKWQEKP
jgi:hypothetical protein